MSESESLALSNDFQGFLTNLASIDSLGLSAAFKVLGSILKVSDGMGRDSEATLSKLLDFAPTSAMVDLVKTTLLLIYGSNISSPEMIKDNLKRAPFANPSPEMDITDSLLWPSRSTFDVVVIGSGAGGAMAAMKLAKSGLSVVILEEGRAHDVSEFRTGKALDRFQSLYRSSGATFALGKAPVVLPIGRGVGGTTLVNSGTCFRTPNGVLDNWHKQVGLEFADRTVFSKYLDEVEDILRVAPAPLDVMGNNGLLAIKGATSLGYQVAPLRRNAPGCMGSCQCAIGCPQNAKNGVHLNALPLACSCGAKIVSNAKVLNILHNTALVKGAEVRAYGIRAKRKDGSCFEILADQIVVACGATETPGLLRRSGLAKHKEVGRNLAIHPAVSACGWFEEEVYPNRGILQSVGIEEFHESDGILIEATSTPPGMGSVILPGFGKTLRSNLERSLHLSALGAMVADMPSGAVYGSKKSFIFYNLDKRDFDRLMKGVSIMGRVLFKAGAKSVLTGIRGNMEATNVAELDEAISHASLDKIHLAAFHPTGTMRMGLDENRYPVDQNGRLRGVKGLFVSDASVLPTCPEVNPQVTIMAISSAISDYILADSKN
ncbi:MAG: FAD-binding protein [Acidimicrobiales bacterium]|nr:FAD-binding protein [Acidimicrobiales bacterium]